MSCRYDVDDRGTYLQVVPTGRIDSLEELTEHANQIFTYAIQYGKKCILMDEKDIVLGISLVDILNWVESLDEKRIFNLGLRVAVLPSNLIPQTISRDLELFLQSRHYKYKLFDDISSALFWLGQSDCNMNG